MPKFYLSEAEREALWPDDRADVGPDARAWANREERYRKALEGILACNAPENPGVLMLQAVAAHALGYDDLAARLTAKLEEF